MMLEESFVPYKNNYGSRKFILTIVALMLVTGISTASIWYPGIQAVLPSFIGGILGILSLYFGGNVASKYVNGKVNQMDGGDNQ